MTGISLVINADDFGRSGEINAAIIKAHQEGILSSASLMVAEDACQEAVMLAHANPGLAVGLHLVLASGKSCLDHTQIPHLVKVDRQFSGSPALIGIRILLIKEAQDELHKEITAQFEAFRKTGLSLSHVDSHLHFHMHPTVLRIVLPLAVSHGAKGIRLPLDDYRLAIAYNREALGRKTAWHLVYASLASQARRQIDKTDLVTAGRVYGLMQSGCMEEGYMLRLLSTLETCLLRTPVAEIYFHPSLSPGSHRLGPNPVDLATLLSPIVRQDIERRGYQITSYRQLGKEI